MKYIELTVHTTSQASELVADAMWEVSSYGVAVSDFQDVVALQSDKTVYWDYLDDSVTRRSDVLVKCFFDPQTADGSIRTLLLELVKRKSLSDLDFGTLEATRREIEGDDWIDVWKKHFRPIPFGKIVVVPEWIDYTPKKGELPVLLDSSMAFGTGEHETTALCIELLQRYVKSGDFCLDVGCGSGILGIAAVKLGAKHAYLSDIDPIAVESAAHNSKQNGVIESVTVTESDLLGEAAIKADLIVANITAEILVRLAPSAARCLKKDGHLLLSGILTDRVSLVKDAFQEVGLTTIEEHTRGEWCALVLKFA